jgi:3-methylcrotonyl-CoA carboxylase alpha subunit
VAGRLASIVKSLYPMPDCPTAANPIAPLMFSNVLIANRGEIAVRIIRTARRMGLKTIVLNTPADRGALFARLADSSIEIGEGARGYLDADAIIAAAKAAGAQCLHPGYGFLSENAGFADALEREGIAFVGPPGSAMRAMGLKSAAKALMVKAGAPVVPGYHGDNQNSKFLKEKAYEIGYPVLIKAIAGGGGRGMRRVDAHMDFDAALDSAQREGQAAFGDPRVLIEKYVLSPRHIEVQVFGDKYGEVVHLFERDCSLQRRHQKVIEESPAFGLPDETRAAMYAAAVKAAKAVGYVGAGTVEFIVDGARGLGLDSFFFLEMNTRLQVEHPVTEAITGLDLVEWQLRVAAGEPLPLRQHEIRRNGAAVEARICAENPENGFLPSPGRLLALDLGGGAEGLRVEAGGVAGDSVTPFYDSMIAKMIAHALTREAAFDRLADGLAHAVAIGPKTNIAFLSALIAAPEVRMGSHDTGFIDAHLRELGAAQQPPDPRATLVAAERLFRARIDATPTDVDPWSTPDSFELTGRRRTPFEVRVDGQIERLVVVALGAQREVRFADGRDSGGQDPVALYATEQGFFALSRGRQSEVAAVDPLQGAAAGATEETGEILTPMTGRLIALFVAAGDLVEVGARLAVVEAMKMEHALTAPRAGKIVGLSAAVGDNVELGQMLMEVLADEGAV